MLRKIGKLFGIGLALAILALAVGNQEWVGLGQAQEQFLEGFETGDLSRLPWQTGGDAPWFVTSSERHSGTYAAQAGDIGDNGISWLQFTQDVESGEISFWFKVSSEEGHDFLHFYIDGEEKGKWSGEIDWQQVSYEIATGTHTFRWEYTKDGSESKGQDTAWIDDLSLISPPPPPCTVTLAPGQSIQEAIDAASPGDVICLSEGEWRENLTIEKSLTLRAAEIKAEPDVVIKSAKEGRPVILIKSDQEEVRIEGLKVTGAFGYCYKREPEWICPDGIEIRGQAKAVIQNNTISGNWGDGIGMGGSSQAEISDSQISGNGHDGIGMGGSSQATIENNTISSNRFGIVMEDSSQATIENNTIRDNEWDGIVMEDSSQATIENNTIRDNEWDGIVMEDSSQATISSSTISGNGWNGITVADSSQATISSSQISGNGEDGIWMRGSSQATIRSNEIFENKGYGVALYQRPCFDTDERFTGKVEGSGNEIHDNGWGDVCPEELEFLMTEEGGQYP